MSSYRRITPICAMAKRKVSGRMPNTLKFTQALSDSGWQVDRVEPIDSSRYDTEFWTPFDRLPPAVAQHLLAQRSRSLICKTLFHRQRLLHQVSAL